jgi:hypothetical protein
MLTPPSTRNVAIFDGVSFEHSGSTGSSTNSVTVQRWNGLVGFFGCSAIGAAKDAINITNVPYTDSSTAGITAVLTVNCEFPNPGRGNNVSCNSQTAHATNVRWLDVASRNSLGKGGTVRHVDASEAWMVGAQVFDDMGDEHTASGSTPPTAIRADDTAEIWLDRCVVDQPGGGYALHATLSSAIHVRDSIVRGMVAGNVDAY